LDEPQIRVEFGDSYINMEVRFLCDVRKRAKNKSDIVWKILKKFNAPENKDKVEIAYPHTELVFHKEVTGSPWKEFLDRK
jgi:small-conductance mechanosensitive channel